MSHLDRHAERRHRRRNRLQALLLLTGMAVVLGVCAWLIAGRFGVTVVAVAGLLTLALRPTVPPEWVLRAYGAQRLPAAAAPQLHRFVEALAARAGLPARPRLYYVASPMLNAFAVGRPHDAAIAVTDGLLRGLSGRELAGVLGHEISHVRADDLWVMTLADTIGRLTHVLAYAGVALLALGLPLLAVGTAGPLLIAVILAAVPTVVTLLQLALSRSREYDADLEAARLTGDPAGLASALCTLERTEGRIWERILVPHGRAPDPVLLRTHPPTEERVRRLAELVGEDAGTQRALGLADGALRDRAQPPVGYQRIARPVRLRRPGVWW